MGVSIACSRAVPSSMPTQMPAGGGSRRGERAQTGIAQAQNKQQFGAKDLAPREELTKRCIVRVHRPSSRQSTVSQNASERSPQCRLGGPVANEHRAWATECRGDQWRRRREGPELVNCRGCQIFLVQFTVRPDYRDCCPGEGRSQRALMRHKSRPRLERLGFRPMFPLVLNSEH